MVSSFCPLVFQYFPVTSLTLHLLDSQNTLKIHTEKPKCIIWLIWAIVCRHYTDKKDSFVTHFWVILSLYWPTMAQMSQMIHSGFSVHFSFGTRSVLNSICFNININICLKKKWTPVLKRTVQYCKYYKHQYLQLMPFLIFIRLHLGLVIGKNYSDMAHQIPSLINQDSYIDVIKIRHDI